MISSLMKPIGKEAFVACMFPLIPLYLKFQLLVFL